MLRKKNLIPRFTVLLYSKCPVFNKILEHARIRKTWPTHKQKVTETVPEKA